VLSAGQGTRFILASTDQLHNKISEMSARIRQLEDALAIVQAAVSDQRHPLLDDELLKIKFGSEVLGMPDSSRRKDSEGTSVPGGGGGVGSPPVDRTIDAFGTLTMSDAGEVKYFGRSAGSETLMMTEDPSADEEYEEDGGDGTGASTGEGRLDLDSLFPFVPRSGKGSTQEEALDVLEGCLPSKERAMQLCESYIDHASHFFRPIKREELLDSFLPAIYSSASLSSTSSLSSPPTPTSPTSPTTPKRNTPHALSTLFFLFALGALLDLSLSPYNSEAERYYELGRAALSRKVVFESPTVDTVRALGLMATYHCLGGRGCSRNSAVSLF
jgi:hypothetical protein